ncbi:DNL zinc finger-domain-containing protein [Aspergillus egyptiacus]|nr:DNL zinc finger-domain-containing protein [Aspergillus egyptiacus]
MQKSLRLSRTLRAFPTTIPQPALSRGAPSRLYSQLYSQRISPRHFTQPSLPTYLHRSSRIGPVQSIGIRYNSSSSTTPSSPLTDHSSSAETDASNEEQNRLRREQEPAYQLTFTCKPCGERSSHRVSKHGYHRGTVLIQCPGCKNRHVISDNLNIFFDSNKTLEDLLSERGQKVTRGELQGDMEFWDDGTVTKRDGTEAKPE